MNKLIVPMILFLFGCVQIAFYAHSLTLGTGVALIGMGVMMSIKVLVSTEGE